MPNARILAALTVLLSVIWAVPARAEEAPPSRVARVSAASGAVSLRPAGGEWNAATTNDPLVAGMALRTAGPARAGIGIGALRSVLAGGSEAEITRLDDTVVQIALKQGRIGIHLARLDPGAVVEIDLPQGGIWLLAPGDYDINAGNDQTPGRVAAFAGQAQFAGSGADRMITGGSALALNAKGPAIANAVADDFTAQWRRSSDNAAEPAALRHVSAEMTGWDVLDGAGSWETADGLGAVWVPASVPEDWAPYRYGHWRWVMPWGWNWVDDMPWGFAPSHYGRWARIAGTNAGTERWAWVPGADVAHPIYMPAAINFIGSAGIGSWEPISIGTTTSARMNRFTEGLLRDHGARAIIGKGGLPADALQALAEQGGVYLAVVGGAAALETQQIDAIERVEWEDLMPECLWLFRVSEFGPLIVGMDSHGASLYEHVHLEARRRLEHSIYARL
jgi:tartrate/fumarate subfamily iron-sulfur-dependent hydro-lyase beta chain